MEKFSKHTPLVPKNTNPEVRKMYELYDDYPIDEVEDEFNAFSATEMTGAVPRAILSEEELESYEDVYPFMEEEL
ncbi:MAG: hypothetical protein IIU14_06005 [Ruminococcus sp.]|nr:hypothetical protein [Ruminococcus sp.]